MNRGKLAILAMFVIAGILGLVSVGYHTWASHGVLAWWGGDAARLIADAPQCRAIELQPGGGNEPSKRDQTLQIDGQIYRIVRSREVAAVEGLDHLRRGLLDDGNFVWPAQPLPHAEHWTDALVFSDGTRQATVLFDFAGHRVGQPDASTVLAIDQIASGWQDFFNDVWPKKSTR